MQSKQTGLSQLTQIIGSQTNFKHIGQVNDVLMIVSSATFISLFLKPFFLIIFIISSTEYLLLFSINIYCMKIIFDFIYMIIDK